jgi:hypothetical protein
MKELEEQVRVGFQVPPMYYYRFSGQPTTEENKGGMRTSKIHGAAGSA